METTQQTNELPTITEMKWDRVKRPFFVQCGGCQHKQRFGQHDNPWYWTCRMASRNDDDYADYDPGQSEFCSIRNERGDCSMASPLPVGWWRAICITCQRFVSYVRLLPRLSAQPCQPSSCWNLLGNPFDFGRDQEYVSAQEKAHSFEPADDADYEWVFDYAQHSYDHTYAVSGHLDDKADSIIKYLGAFSGLSAFLAAYIATSTTWTVALSVIPAFCLSAWAIVLAARARRIVDQAAPPSIDAAIDYAEAYGEKASATFIPQIWAATVAVEAVCNAKGRLIDRATNVFLWATISLGLPLAASVLWKLLDC